jgi:hypothetical protein
MEAERTKFQESDDKPPLQVEERDWWQKKTVSHFHNDRAIE